MKGFSFAVQMYGHHGVLRNIVMPARREVLHLNPKDFQHEIAYFDEVEEIIRMKIKILQDKKINLRQQVVSERKHMWEENRHMLRDFDDVVELSSLDRNVTDTEIEFERNTAELQRMERMLQKPYFGRIDFEDRNRRSRTIYIGLHSLINDEPHKIYVVDWRAPAASMFYTFDLGPAWYETQMNKREVVLTLKRQYEIENGRLKYAYDTDSSMHDAILGEVLSKNTDSKLKVIIGSIQKEQNEAIRCNTRQSSLIYGLAGSGKTSVGLHRLAYILYQNRDTIAAENILIISNNNVYSSYVASILPELGEKAVETVVFSDLLSLGMDGKFNCEGYYEQLGKIGNHVGVKRAEDIRRKYSLELLRFFVKYFSNFSFRIPEIRYKDAVVFSPEIFNQKWKNTGHTSFKQNYERINNLIIKSVEDYFSANREAICRDIVENHDEFLLKDEIPLIFRKTVQRCIDHAVNEFASLNQLDPQSLLVDALAGYCREAGAEEPLLSFGQRKLFYEDALLYMLVQVLMGKIPANNDIYHIVIDEAQDYNPIQLYIIKSLFPKSSFTLLADIYQTVNPITTIQDYRFFEDIFGYDIAKICLEKCYRSSSDINALAFQLIDSVENPVKDRYSYFARAVKKPQYIVKQDIFSCINPILRQLEKYNTAAVITNTVEEAVAVGNYLRDTDGLPCKAQVIRSAEDKITSRLVVLPILFAKGLEFDAVILINFAQSNIDSPELRRKVYLGCTRALHELYLLEDNALPEALNDCSAYLEVQNWDE